MTRPEIESQLRTDNPTTTDDDGWRHGPGSDYYEAAIQRWADAMEVQDAAPPSLAAKVSPRQIRLALLSAGITPAMIAANLAGNPAALIEWEYALEIARDNPLVAAMGDALGFNSDEIDALFESASLI